MQRYIVWVRPLVIRYRKLGDTIMATPILRSLKESGAEAVFTVGEAAYHRVFAEHPAVSGHIDLSQSAPSRLELVRAGLRARAFRCDIALVLRFSRRASLVARLAGCRTIAGSLEPRSFRSGGGLTANVWDGLWKELHQVEKYYRVAEAVAGSLARYPTYYAPAPEAAASLGPLPASLAVVHVGSGGSNNGWQDEAYAQTAVGLRAMGLKVAATGAVIDAATHPKTRAAADLDLVGKTGLDGLATLFQAARLVVGLDGGATRVASAVGAPVIALSIGYNWGVHQIYPWMAKGELLEPTQRCSHCSLHHCDGLGRTCVANLLPDQVLSAAFRMLSN